MALEFNRLDEPDTPPNTLTYFFREALRRIWTSRRSTLVAVSMIAISLLILGMFLLVAENLEHTLQQWQGRSRVNVYFAQDATSDQIAAVAGHLAGRQELTRHRLISRQEALQRFRAYFANVADLVSQLDENPFPPSFEIEVRPDFTRSREFDQEMAAVRKLPGVEHVQFDWDWLTGMRRLVDVLNAVGLIAGGILAVAAAFTIASVIRLTMMLYREEIEIMRLVGATERIVRGPFLVQGLLQGLLGGVIAVLLLYGGYLAGREFLNPSQSLLFGFALGVFLPWPKVTLLILGGLAAGLLGTWLSLGPGLEKQPFGYER